MDSLQTREGIGFKLKKARSKKKLTQAQVAEKAGINTNYYACIERGEVNVSTEKLLKIVKVLGVKSSEVLPF